MEQLRGNRKLARIILFSSLYVLFSLITGYRDIGSRYNMGISNLWLFSITFVFICISLEMYDNKVINNGVCAALGRNSYAIYFVHYILICVIQKYKPNIVASPAENWFVKFILITVVSYVIAIILNIVVEKPIHKLLDKLRKKGKAVKRTR